MLKFRYLKKIYVLVFMAAFLAFSTVTGCFKSFAAYTKDSRQLQPCTYAFTLALQASGVNVTDGVDHFFCAYGAYLDTKGTASALSRYEALKGLSWGESYTQMNDLYQDVYRWLSGCKSVDQSGVVTYHLYAKKPTPLEWPTAEELFSIQTVPYDLPGYENYSVVTSGKNHYLFSDTYGSYTKRNVLVENGVEVFGVVSKYFPYRTSVEVRFYKIDPASASGYSAYSFPFVTQNYDSNYNPTNSFDSNNYHGPAFNYCYCDSKWFMNLPLPILLDLNDISDYLSGESVPVIKDNVYPLPDVYTVRAHEQFNNLAAVKGNVILPASSDAGVQILSNLAASSDASLANAFRGAGVSIVWEYPYTVSYYFDGEFGSSNSFTVAAGDNTVISVPEVSRSGYRLADPPHTPALPAVIDEVNNVIRVDYESWMCPYTVEYYYDNFLKERKELSVPSYDNVVKEVPLFEGSGIYKLSESPYSPGLPFTVDDQNHVLKVLYVSPTGQAVTKQVGVVFQSIKKFIVSAFPVLIGLVLVVFLIIFVIKWYKRITQKG